MNINRLGNIYDRTYTTHQTNKNGQSFAEYMDKANENKDDISDMFVNESTEEKSDDKKEMPDEGETRTEIVVRPDGSKVLMITVTVGGQEAVTSVELAKPTKGDIPSKDISGNVDVKDTTEKLEEKSAAGINN